MSVHYKFKSALEYDTITFDGLHISVKDLKNAIIQQKRIGKSTDFDLQVTNAQTKEVYTDENVLIPKNTSLLIARIPNVTQSKPKQWEGYGGDSSPTVKADDIGPIGKTADLSSLDAPEDDKIKAMMSQSTQDYDPSNYQKIRGSNQMGAVPPSYRCYKCHQTGHWIKDCTFAQGADAVEIKKSTGIPQSFMVPVDGPQVPGAMMTPNGSYAVPVLDHQAYNFKPVPAPVVQELKPDIPEDLVCSICSDLLADAVMIPCCGNSFCDECIRFYLLESEDHECPDCHEKDISPGTLIPNRFLRKSVANFKNTTGYVKKPIFRPPPKEVPITKKVPLTELSQQEGKNELDDQRTIISEADSTEQAKNKQADKDGDGTESSKSADISESELLKDGPPGTSPKQSPKGSQIRRLETTNRSDTNGRSKKNRDDFSPRHKSSHSSNTRRSPPSYDRERNNEDRPGTPTVDEPGVGSNPYPYSNNGPSQGGLGNMMSMSNVQGPPPTVGPTYPPGQPINTFPPTTGPPPNFRLPPPGSVPYMPPGPYANPPRPMFDPTRPPMAGPPPFNPGFPPRQPHHREYDRRMRNRTPPGIIDDPLAAFNRMIREKEERERRAKQRLQRRTYSRSRSRSRSFSPRSPRRRSRSPRRRSRSRSFSMSRSRSRSYSGSVRGGSPPPYRDRDRDYSPRHSPRRGPPPTRYRSPVRSPPRRYKDSHPPERRDRDDYDREYRRDDRDFPSRDHPPRRDREPDRGGEREYRNFDSNFEDRYRGSKGGQWNNHSMGMRGPPEAYYNPPPPEITQGSSYQPPPNRYPATREFPPYMAKPDSMMPTRKYDDVAPPGVEEPPVPGVENSPRVEDKFTRTATEVPPPEVKEKEEKRTKTYKESDKSHRSESHRNEKDKDRDRHRSEKDRDSKRDSRKDKETDRKRRSNKSTTPTRKRSRSRDKETPEKRKRKHDGSSDREKSDKDRKKEYSDDEKSRKSKDKKKKKEKEKKEKEKKKREKKEKHKEKDKERKHKEETKEKERNKVEEIEQEQRIESSPKVESPQKIFKNESPKHIEERVEEERKAGLYDDVIEENIENEVIERFDEHIQSTPEHNPNADLIDEMDEIEEGELEQSRDYEDSERDILELHSNDIDLKAELEIRNEMLAPMPEKSKWEDDDDNLGEFSPTELKGDSKNSKSGTVSNEVLKRAENAIFAKAINAIRPIEIKKISADRAKFYSGEKDDVEVKPIVVQSVAVEKKPEKKVESSAPPPKLSVKDRLGIKVNEPDPVIRLDRLSPFSKRVADRNYGHGERRVETGDRKRDDRSRRDVRSRDSRRDKEKETRKDREPQRSRDAVHRRDEKPKRNRSGSKTKTRDVEKKKRSRSRSESEDRKKKKKEKKHKEKVKKKEEKEEKPKEEKQDALKSATDKRKPTLDEASFEPDYDLESETEEKKEEASSSSDSDSSSSSEEERKKKKRKKHRKKKYRKDSSSSSSDSDSDSSDEERERKRKKHKKNKKKKKKSKHK